MADKKALKQPVAIDSNKNVLDAVVEVMVRNANCTLEAAAQGSQHFEKYLEAPAKDISKALT